MDSAMSNHSVEKNALIAAAIINILMAISGWLAFYFSGSQAVLLDGNFSFIAVLTTLIAIRISMIKARRTEVFPFGQFVYEAIFSFMKGVMIIGMLLMALTVNISRVFHYLNGEPANALNTGVILIYTLFMVFLCVILALYCRHQNNKINNASTILHAEYAGAKIDGVLSLGTGMALFAIGFVNIAGDFGFLHYIGDALLVIILVLLLGKEPLTLVRESFIELAGGTLQNQVEKRNIEKILDEHLGADELLKDSYISKTGSSYLVVAYICDRALDKVGAEKVQQLKELILLAIKENHQETMLEIVLA